MLVNPSMEEIWLFASLRLMRAVKRTRAISLRMVGLLFFPTSFITYWERAFSLSIQWCYLSEGAFILSTTHILNKFTRTYLYVISF